jgi:TadE-like protein
MEQRTLWQKTDHLRYRIGRVARGYNTRHNSADAESDGQAGLVVKALKPTPAVALVEFTYVSIPLLMLLLGIFEFGIVFWNQQRVETVTREIARRAAACGNVCDYFKEYGFDSDSTSHPDVFTLSGIWTASNPPPPPAPIQAENYYFIDPSRIQYIWIQRISNSGKITVDKALGEEPPIVARPAISTTNYISLYRVYRYDGGETAFAPFKLDTTTKSPVDGSTPMINGVGYASAGYSVNNTYYIGRSACEPTHRLWVEVKWNHKWASPIQYLPLGDAPIGLTSRRAVKVEPFQFQINSPGATCLNE